MRTAKELFYSIKEDNDRILESVDWNAKGLSPEEVISLIEIKAMYINLDKKLSSVINDT